MNSIFRLNYWLSWCCIVALIILHIYLLLQFRRFRQSQEQRYWGSSIPLFTVYAVPPNTAPPLTAFRIPPLIFKFQICFIFVIYDSLYRRFPIPLFFRQSSKQRYWGSTIPLFTRCLMSIWICLQVKFVCIVSQTE